MDHNLRTAMVGFRINTEHKNYDPYSQVHLLREETYGDDYNIVLVK